MNGEEVLSCTILTCGPNKVMGELHDRMPVILAEETFTFEGVLEPPRSVVVTIECPQIDCVDRLAGGAAYPQEPIAGPDGGADRGRKDHRRM